MIEDQYVLDAPKKVPCWCALPFCISCESGPALGCFTSFFYCLACCSGMYSYENEPEDAVFKKFSRKPFNIVNKISTAPAVPQSTKKEVYSFDKSIKTANNENLNVRVYGNTTGNSRTLIMLFHGGGFCINRNTSIIYDSLAMKFASAGHCVLSVDYRLSPEFPYPVPLQDCYDATVWAVSSPEAREIIPVMHDELKLILLGESAGANLALVIATLLRDNLNCELEQTKNFLKPAHLILQYPWLLHSPLTPSAKKFYSERTTTGINGSVLSFFAKAYLQGQNSDKTVMRTRANALELLNDRCVAPLNGDLSRLPPVTMITGGNDPLHDEDAILEQRLTEANVPCKRFNYHNVAHGFMSLGILKSTKLAMNELLTAVEGYLQADAEMPVADSRT